MSTSTVMPAPVAQTVVFPEYAVCFELVDGPPLLWRGSPAYGMMPR